MLNICQSWPKKLTICLNLCGVIPIFNYFLWLSFNPPLSRLLLCRTQKCVDFRYATIFVSPLKSMKPRLMSDFGADFTSWFGFTCKTERGIHSHQEFTGIYKWVWNLIYSSQYPQMHHSLVTHGPKVKAQIILVACLTHSVFRLFAFPVGSISVFQNMLLRQLWRRHAVMF